MILARSVLSKLWLTVHEVREAAVLELQEGPSVVPERGMDPGGRESSLLT